MPPKVPLPVDRLPNPNTCLIRGPVRPMVPNGCRLRSAVFPQCTGQTDRPTDRQTDRQTDRTRESLMTIGRCAPRATRPNNNNNTSSYGNHISKQDKMSQQNGYTRNIIARLASHLGTDRTKHLFKMLTKLDTAADLYTASHFQTTQCENNATSILAFADQ